MSSKPPDKVCVHLRLSGTQAPSGDVTLKSVRVTGAHEVLAPAGEEQRACSAVSDSYRDGWDRIFGGRLTPAAVN